jgi:hypothetical protein
MKSNAKDPYFAYPYFSHPYFAYPCSAVCISMIMASPKFCQNCGLAWLDSPSYKKCCSCSWKPSTRHQKTKKQEPEPHRDAPDDSDDGLQVLTNDQWIQEAKKKKKIGPGDKTTFAANISQAVKREKANEDMTRIEVKLQRQKKVIKDRADKKERQEGVQGGFGHDPRNEPAFSQWREIEIWLMEEGVQMYRLQNSAHAKKICLSESLPDIDIFVRQHVRDYNKWDQRANKKLVEDDSFKAYIAYHVGNATPFEVPFEASVTTTWGDFLKEFDSIKAKKEKSKLVLAFPTKALESYAPPKRSTIAIPRPNNKRSRSRLRGSDEDVEESGGEEGLLAKSERMLFEKSEQGLFVFKSEPQEAGKAEDPENGDSDSSPCSGESVVEPGDSDSGDGPSSTHSVYEPEVDVGSAGSAGSP